MRTRIMLIGASLITGLVVGYNFNKPSSPEIRRAIAVTKSEPEVRRAIPVEQEVRKAIAVQLEVRRAKPVVKRETARSTNDVANAIPIIDVDAGDDDELALEESRDDEESPGGYYYRGDQMDGYKSFAPASQSYQSVLYSPPAVQFYNVWQNGTPSTYSVTRPNDITSFVHDWSSGKTYSVTQPNDTSVFVHEW
jgi:hypothetical protein